MTGKGGMTDYDRKHKQWLFAERECGTRRVCESVKVIQSDMERKRQCTAETLGSDTVKR